MKFLYLILTLVAVSASAQDNATTTIYLIRHAEKADTSADPDLSAAGEARAKKWGEYFADKNIQIGYASYYRRARQTLAPIISRGVSFEPEKNSTLQIKTYNPNQFSLKDVADDNPGKNIVVVGHSNTLPVQINTFLAEEVYKEIPEDQFGNLYVIKITGDTVTHELVKM